MKKTFILFAVVAAIASCGNNENKTATNDMPASNKPADNQPADLSANPDYTKGLALVGQSDCLTCHQIDEAFTGPSYVAVANKYAGQQGIEDSLAQKIIKGGSGVWGTVPMTPHPTLSEADAKAMVKYILLLKK